MTQLWLVRHGQTDWNLEGRYQGQADPPLNTNGWAQARALAARLSGTGFEAVYTSDLQRAYAMATIIGDRLRLTVTPDKRLREINQGAWEGMLLGDIMFLYPRDWSVHLHNPLHARPPGGESVAEVAARVCAAADDIARAHPVGPVLIVSHGLSLATLLCRVRRLSLQQAYSLIPDNAAPLDIEWPAGEL